MGEEQSFNNSNNDELINNILKVIQIYKEAISEKVDFVKGNLNDIQKTRKILQTIKDVLTELSNIEPFKERATELLNICEELIERYNKVHNGDSDKDLGRVDDYIKLYKVKQKNEESKGSKIDLESIAQEAIKEHEDDSERYDVGGQIEGMINVEI